VGGTWAGESADRPNLDLDDNVDNLISKVADHSKKVVVLMQIPGAVLMPWRHVVPGILVMFLGGQETGSAWADVLFGDHPPSGRLPVMIPATENDTIPPVMKPANATGGPTVNYVEGMKTSYRNKDFESAFPFGHGLTYTTFNYFPPNVTDCGYDSSSIICIQAPVQNSGKVAAKAVVQLYLEFSPEAGHPAPLLKGFEKTGVLLPGHTQVVTFGLTNRDLSYYDPYGKVWVRAVGAKAHIAESSTIIRHSLPLDLPSAGVNMWLIFIVLVFVGVNVLLVWMWLRRRRTHQDSDTSGDEGSKALCGDTGMCMDDVEMDRGSDSEEDGGKFVVVNSQKGWR